MAYRFTNAFGEFNESCTAIIDKLNSNFEAAVDTGERAAFRLSASLIANTVMVIGLVARAGNITDAKLERQLKQLQIIEKRTKLEQHGSHLKNYS
jgi:hypothetical protein